MDILDILRNGDIQDLNKAITANPNILNEIVKGNSPLHLAINERNKDFINFMINNGADVNLTNTLGMTPLQRLVGVGMDDMATKIMSDSNLNHKDKLGYTALGYAIEKKNLNIIGALIEHGADVNQSFRTFTPLTLATITGDEKMVKLLVENGADIDKVDANGVKPSEHTNNKKLLDLLGGNEPVGASTPKSKNSSLAL